MPLYTNYLSNTERKNLVQINCYLRVPIYALTMQKICLLLLLALSACAPHSSDKATSDSTVYNLTTSIPMGGNSWVLGDLDPQGIITPTGVEQWTRSATVIRCYFYAHHIGELGIGLRFKSPQEDAVIKLSHAGVSKEVKVTSTHGEDDIYVGNFELKSTGYTYIDIQGISKQGDNFGELRALRLGGPAAQDVDYIKEEKNFYFGRRGPSVHLKFDLPEEKDITWFYNEIKVPAGNDVIGSYYMANGFSNGYFGMQVNSATERRILFSVWSAYDTQDPNQIPDAYKVLPLGSGQDVHVGEFGNEGAGAQSYFVYDWKPDTTYKFLLKGASKIDDSIDYTAYFYAPELGEWKLIASFRKPKTTDRHILRPYSFLENFVPNSGYLTRKVFFDNQWAYDTEGQWHELTTANYTADATAREGVRFDYDGGVAGQRFYLRNCGFFNDKSDFDVRLTRTAIGVAPTIDFNSLPHPTP